MRRTAAILTLILVVSLLGTSDVRGGGGALTPVDGRTIGPRLIATIVTDVTGTGDNAEDKPGKGLTSIRVQKLSQNVAAIFTSGYVNSFVNECIAAPSDLEETTANRFTGFINGFVDDPGVLISLLQPFVDPANLLSPDDLLTQANKAAIIAQDDVACTAVNGRKILSFTAVIKFEKPPR